MSEAQLKPISAPPRAFTIKAEDAERLTGGTWQGTAREVTIRGAAIDSRLIAPGCLFACLPGNRSDGHDFAAAAVGTGAAMILASKPVTVPAPVLLVEDVGKALAQLASEFRKRVVGATWIGVTGSNGKTTVKELLAAACVAGTKKRVHATRGNLNNHLGVPLTILATPDDVSHVIIEMGANHPGEIAFLSGLARPDIGVITNIGPAHLEGFGSLLGVARAKGELFAALPDSGSAFIGVHGLEAMAQAHGTNSEALISEIRTRAGRRKLLLVGSKESPVSGDMKVDSVVLKTAAGTAAVPLLGEHNLANVALAFHAVCAAGIAPADALKGLAQVAPVAGRLRAIRTERFVILDDSYNANPASMVAGLQVLAQQPGKRLAVLGAMGELGESDLAGHRHVGTEAARLGLALMTIGENARPIGDAYVGCGGKDYLHIDDRESAVRRILERTGGQPTTILVKASRSSGLDAVVQGLITRRSPITES
jgi:UDP-N-acetylmuramoyl-tripeptide--D-alanyl-D-alanine ligase